MIKPRIQVGYFGLVISLFILLLIPLNVYAQENPVNIPNLIEQSQIKVTGSLTQSGSETSSFATMQPIIKEGTYISLVPSVNITIPPTIPFSTDQILNTTFPANQSTTEISSVTMIIPISTASNQNSVQGSNPGSTNSLYFSPEDSPLQEPVNESKKDVITDSRTGQKYAKDRVIVRFKSSKNAISSVSEEKIRMAHAKVGAKVKKDFSAGGITGLQLVQLPNRTDVQSAIREYQSNPDVLYAEPDYVVSIIPDQTGSIVQDTNPEHILIIPNDGFFSELWGLHNTGQSGGTPDADIDAPEAWDISTGSGSVVVAVIDTGVLYTHSDLSPNIWNNTGEIPDNGIDDDGNGYIDDIRGWDFVNNDNDPTDDNSHGTHVSGTIGATGNNTLGVAGVNWQVKIMPLKGFDSAGNGITSAEIAAIQYANEKGAVVISNSWGGGNYSQSLKDVIDAYPGVVVCAAGNTPLPPEPNNDIIPIYPASYDSVNIISVAATESNDQLASFSHYGQMSVDLAAPGTNILSTYFDGNYAYKQGTSMATPHVSGVAALVKAVNQSLSSAEIKTIILSTVDAKSSLSGKVATGGRLNAYNAILATPPAVPVADFSGVPTSGTGPTPVSFTDLSLNNPTGWAWFFGDETYTAPWTLMNASAGWSGRWGHSSVAMPDGSIVLMGGYGGGIKNDTWRSTDNGATWTQVNASAGWTGRVYHSSVAMPDGSIALMGGDDGVGIKSDVWRSTDNGVTWTQVNASAGWSGRWGHSSVAMPDCSIVLMGGYGGGIKNDTWRSTDNGATWTQVNASAGWLAREYHSSVAMPDGSIVLMGGTDNYTYSYLNDVWRSTNSGALWTQVNTNAGWSTRFLHSSVVMPDGSIVLMGGFGSDGYKNDVWRSTDNGASWIQVNASAGWTKRWDHKSVAMPDGSIVLIGGVDGSAYKNDVWRFNPVGSSAQNPSHTYTTPGIYQVALQAYNIVGYNSTRKTGYITVTGSPAPVADFTGTPREGTAPLTVVFTDLSAGGPSSWNWSFGDGNTTNSTVQNPVHTFLTPGNYTVSLTVANTLEGNTTTRIGYINVTNATHQIGIFRPSVHTFYLKNGTKTTAINWGISTDLPVTGDWNGDGRTEVGVYRPSAHTFYLKNGSALSWTTTAINWGTSTDLPVTGDWNGDGRTEVGVYRPSAHTFYLKNGSALSWTTTAINWGTSTDLPITGDWNGDGRTEVGVYRPSAHTFYLKNGSALSWTTTATDWGTSTDLPVTGKWS
jgi:PKD repeat protein